jgi:Glycosyl transferases group 1
VFAMYLLAALSERHGWDGRLVLAGPRIRHGSSAGEEAAWRALNPGLSERVIELPAVDEATKAWLYEHAAAVVYPTVCEGFGLVPFEAAAVGVPCLFAHQASLAEVLPDATGTLIPWDAAASADASIGALTDPARRQELVDEVRRSAERFTWDATARKVLDAYERALVSASREASRIAEDGVFAELDRAKYEARYWELWNEIGPTGLALVGPDPWLPVESQRALAALARRNATRRPLLATLRALHRIGTIGRSNGPAPERDQADEPDRPPELA